MASPPEPIIHHIFEPRTATWQYVVADPATLSAVIIDPVLDFDPSKTPAVVSTESADALLALAKEKGYKVVRLLETHAHADHLTAAKYLQTQIEGHPGISIGKRIGQVQNVVSEKYGLEKAELEEVFDHLLDDNEEFDLGELKVKAVHLPGHTPDHIGYIIGSNIFCGDSLFNADVGSARCDFPGGSAPALFHSVRDTLLQLPPHYKIWTGHDYPPGPDTRAEPLAVMTVEEQRRENKHLKDGVVEEDFVKWRRERDAQLGDPRLLHYALQVNVRAGRLPEKNAVGARLLKVPVKGGEWQ